MSQMNVERAQQTDNKTNENTLNEAEVERNLINKIRQTNILRPYHEMRKDGTSGNKGKDRWQEIEKKAKRKNAGWSGVREGDAYDQVACGDMIADATRHST